MLKNSLIAKTSPVANKKNVVLWNCYRVTVLSDRLFRIERSDACKFRDEATQSVFYRDMLAQKFTCRRSKQSAVIDTGVCKLILREEREDCRIVVDGKRKKIENKGNLGGTYRTLDACDGDVFYDANDASLPAYGRIELGTGVCSTTGVALFDDVNSLTLGADGEIKPVCGNGTDEYVFAYGDDYRAAVNALYMITGKTPLVPRYALGNWWSRYHVYTDREYLTVLDAFKEKEIPLTVATIDMDWHYSIDLESDFHMAELGRNTPFYGGDNGWTGYTWNKNLFPDYKKFLKEIEDRNLKITLNLHPADGVRWWEDAYPQMAEVVGIDPKTAQKVEFDLGSTDFINAYFDILHKPYEKDGVSFWWMDWQQGEKSTVEGLDPLWSLNHYHYLDNAENHFNPLLLSRFCGVGSHRYPVGFSGDTYITWDTLDYLPYFTATATNVGYTWWSHDIGGHMRGEKNDEMYLRHVQYGVFSPINRLHCSCAETCTKEPWMFLNGTGKIAEEWLKLRHQMIPYLYTMSQRTHEEGRGLVEPLYYEWQQKAAYVYNRQYLFGDLLVAPVTTPMKKDGYARVKAWLPEGVWTDIFTGDRYEIGEGGKELTLLRSLDSIPVLAKAGTIIPFSMDKGNSPDNPRKLDVCVYRGTGAFTLFEDGREHGDEKSARTAFTAENGNGKQTLKIYTTGEKGVIPTDRTLRISFKDIEDGEVSVYKNGEKLSAERLYTTFVAVEFSYDEEAEYLVEVSYLEKSRLERLVDVAMRELTIAQHHSTNCKNWWWNQLRDCKTVEEFYATVERSELAEVTKLRLKELL